MTARITRVEIHPLPRWARLALAVRCLKRARAIVHPSAGDAAVLDLAIDQIERSAAMASPADGLGESAAKAYALALDNLDASSATEEAGDRDVVTCMVAHAAAFAAEAVSMVDAHRAAHLVAQSVDFVVHAFRLSGSANTEEAMAAMRTDLERLWAVEAKWDDRTPVGSDFW